ncbi:MAG: SpoVR family protein [Thermodesulfobacteriota bacterium]
MELVDQHVKGIMEGCKERARDQGLSFDDETLEYIVTNRDMIELGPKVMIPTLYDYWVHDVRVISGKGRYELYPDNPFETVINTRPAISFYNDNNPDWLNVMIFYHVLAHIDFFQNNLFFRHTWDMDFTGKALSDKRVIARYRAEKGRWVDYVIEFTRGIDNLVGYHRNVSSLVREGSGKKTGKTDYYFDTFLQQEKNVTTNDYLREIERYNFLQKDDPSFTEETFLAEVYVKYPEFSELYRKKLEEKDKIHTDVVDYIMKYSPFLREDKNKWMKSVMEIVKDTSMFLQPQIRTKIMNEGWASFWHEKLFMSDERIRGHEIDYAKVNASVTAMPKVGLNPYAIGMRLFDHIRDMENRGCYSLDYFLLKDQVKKKRFDQSKNTGMDYIFKVREDLCDFSFINRFIDQEFINRNSLFVSGRRLNRRKMTWEFYVKSRRAEDYREMIINTLYHPPSIHVDTRKTKKDELYLVHKFENKPLKKDFIENTMVGIEYLWGGPVKLETHEPAKEAKMEEKHMNFWDPAYALQPDQKEKTFEWKKVLYVMENRTLQKREI